MRRAQANYYTDYDGERREELFVFFSLKRPIPAPIYASADHCFVKIEDGSGVLKVPLYTEVMKYFYANYKDYYYLPEEDMAVHKYLSSYVERSPPRPGEAGDMLHQEERIFPAAVGPLSHSLL